jgi:hypothetical protein
MITVLWLQPMSICALQNQRFDFSTDCADPALGLNLDILTLFLCVRGGQFQNIEQLDNTEKVGFQPIWIGL